MTMKKSLGLALGVAALALLSACGSMRYAGFNNCSSDGSVVWLEQANSAGSFEGLNNSAANCTKAR